MNQPSGGPSSPNEYFRVVAIVALAFVMGPTLFAAVTLVIKGGSGTLDIDLLSTAWMLMTPAVLTAALVMWGRLVSPHLPRLGVPERNRKMDPAALQTGMITVWALIEGQALFGVAVYFLTDSLIPLAGVGLLWIGMALARPRRAWFGR